MTGFERKQPPQGDQEQPEPGHRASDSGSLLRAAFLVELQKESPALAANGAVLRTLQTTDPGLIACFRQCLRDADPALRERILSALLESEDAAVAALTECLGHDNPIVRAVAAGLHGGITAPSSSSTAARRPPPSRQLLLEFPPDWGEIPAPQDSIPSPTEGDRHALQDDRPRTPEMWLTTFLVFCGLLRNVVCGSFCWHFRVLFSPLRNIIGC
jgi:hypothetical protein